MSNKKLILLAIVVIALALGAIYINLMQRMAPKIPLTKIDQVQDSAPRLSILAANLEIPWALVFLPDKSILFTERPGRVRTIDNKGSLNLNSVAIIDDVLAQGEGGLLGITIHPDFSSNHFVYLYYTYSNINNDTLNRVVRFEFENNKLQNQKTLVDGIPGASNHNGGRIKFGPDGFLYITTGDSQNPSIAQDKNSLAGKILRVTDEGKPAPDNPFNNLVFSFGHRNPQGITWNSNNTLWATEHGPNALDELNIIIKGKNYGWPASLASENVAGRPVIQQSEMVDPIINSGSDTWAPSGAAYLNGSIFFAGLRGQALFEYDIENKTLTPHFKGEIGRIREVIVGPDNLLYITTNNRDGRGFPDATDDKIIRVNPSKL